MTAADTFREIDTQVADVRRKIEQDEYTQDARGRLFGIQRLAQNGLREALADAPKLAAYPHLLAGTHKMIASLQKLANDFGECVVEYRKVADDAQDAIGKPGSEADLTELLAFTRKAEKWLRHRMEDFNKCAVEYRSVAADLDAGLATIPPGNEYAAVTGALAAIAKAKQ